MSWRYLSHLLLLVGLTLIDPSEEGCLDYFKMDSWTKYASLTDPVELVMLNNTKDIMECSVERAYLQSLSRTKNLNLFYILKHCFDRSNVSEISEKCRGETSEEILFYHFMCWTAKAVEIDVPPDYCSDYGTLCSIYAEISFPVTIDETTLPPTTTLESTTATLPPTTNAPTTTLESTTATLPTTTNAPTTLSESTTATLPPTTNAPTTTLESTTATLSQTTNAPTTLSESTTTTLQTATTKATTKVAAIGDDGGGDQSTLPPTTNAPTTLSESTTATLPPTTTTTLQTTTTTKATTKVTAIADAGGRGSQKYNKGSTDTRDTDILNLKILLVISVILNVTVPLIVYLRMRLQKKQQMANGAWIWSDTDPKPNGNVEMVPLQNDA